MLYADGLRVNDLLASVAKGRATGDGTLYGRLLVAVGGRTCGSATGSLPAPARPARCGSRTSRRPASRWTRPTRGGQDPNFAQVKRVLEGAARDLEYDRLKIDLDADDAGTLVARVDVHGKGRTGEHLQELFLTWNFAGSRNCSTNTPAYRTDCRAEGTGAADKR